MVESETIDTSRSSMQKKAPTDPYALDFQELKTQYMADTTKKLKFSKASFLHYCKNPYVYAEKYGRDDTILTMELVQSPEGLQYTTLEDPKHAKKVNAAKKKRDEELAAQAKLAIQEQSDEEEESSDASGSRSSGSEESGSESSGSRSYYSYGSDSGAGSSDNESYYEGEDRMYNEDMFNTNREKVFKAEYALIDRVLDGEKRVKTETTDRVVISIWRIGGTSIHYSRLADVMVPYPPIVSDARFYCSHSSDALYYLALNKEGKQCVVVVHLGDFRWQIFNLNKSDIPILENLENSALIYSNHVLVFQDLSKKRKNALSGDYWAYDLFNQDRIWHGIDVERVFFSGLVFDTIPEENEEGSGAKLKDTENKQITDFPRTGFAVKLAQGKILPPSRICILSLKIEENKDAKKEEEPRGSMTSKQGKDKDEKAPKERVNNKLIYSFWGVPMLGDDDYEKNGKLIWRHEMQTTLAPVEEVGPQQKMTIAKKDIKNTLADKSKLIVAKAEEPEFDMDEDEDLEKKDRDADKKPDVLYANDFQLTEMVMVVLGTDGRQHHVYQFSESQQGPQDPTQRPGNCKVQFNQNTFLRDNSSFFIILITQKGESSAKPLSPADEKGEKLPHITLMNADKDFQKDCWINRTKDGKTCIQTICKSNTDEYLNCSSMDATNFKSNNEETLKKLKTISCKLKGQEMLMQYPCIASNIGSRLINVQSIVQPDIHCQFKLLDGDFLCFSNYYQLSEIGFKDKRTKGAQKLIPLNETGEYIAFLTRSMNKCDKGLNCTKGDILLNLLVVESYAQPMTFTLYTTEYEACMSEGSRDDVMHKSFVIQVNSSRGVDVTLCNQYNDSIIFDCITSTRQKPIMFPYNPNNEEEYEDLDCCKNVKIVPVPMQMDKQGEIHFLVTDPKKNMVKIMRVNSEAEMGNDDFFDCVFTFQSKWVYFFIYLEENNRFYLMDEKKKIKVLVPDSKTKQLSVEATFDLCRAEKEEIDKTPFDEYSVSPGVVHWNGNVMTMLDSRAQDNPTWYQQDVMLEGYQHIAGPKQALGSGQIYYIEQYKDIEDEEIKEDLPDHGKKSFFGEFCVVLQPKADLSFVECLPMANQNNNNFFTFISPQTVMTFYGGRFLVFTRTGNFIGNVQFDCPKHINVKRLRLEHFCEAKQYFVFEGDEMTPEQAEQKPATKEDKKKPAAAAEKKVVQRRFYVFFMTVSKKWWGPKPVTTYTMTLRNMPILPIQNKDLRHHTTHIMSPTGFFEQITVNKPVRTPSSSSSSLGDIITYKVSVLSAQTTELSKPISKINDQSFEFKFNSASFDNLKTSLIGLISPLKKLRDKALKDDKPFAENDKYESLVKRFNELQKAWKYGNYLVAKCGTELAFIDISSYWQTQTSFNFNLGLDVELQNVYQTGIEGLLQFYLIDYHKHLIYAITWNMEINREHNLFQTRYKLGQYPENLILASQGTSTQRNFNFCLEDGCIINLENNLPIQFFDKENEGDLIPHGALKNTVHGQKKVSEDRQFYLDLLHPGRIQHFISLSDLVYWERFQTDKTNHELSKGKVTTFAPISRFPKGISIFHAYAIDFNVISAFESAYELEKSSKSEDKRIQLFPLIFLHKHPKANKQGHRVTPLQVALEKQSPACFELMLSMLTTQQSVCVTGNLLGKLRDVVDNPSTAVMDLMNNCFRVTDQFDGPRPLDWGGDKEELFLDVPTAFLTDKTLQNLVNKAFNTSQPENEPQEIDTSAKQADANNYIQARYDPKTVEALAVLDEAENNKKQVEAKLLDFDWIFTENNAGAMIKCLAETSNDEIFACQQIRILIEFMWQYYYSAIKRSIFYPYVAYFIAFQLYATKLAAHVGDAVDAGYYAEKIALGVFALGWIRFLFLELTQFSVNPSGYIFSFWNILDLTSLAACAAFVFFEYSQMISETNNNILGAGAVLLLWVKLFNWLRIFKSFSAFIRMVSEIVKDIRVFSVMLVLCLTAFANCIIVLNNNRKLTGQDSIFTSYVGWGPADALIHAYLTGLGDNNYDTYSSDDAIAVWILFLGATIIVQLIFMNMLIALMGESFGRISGILEQSTMKELCVMMDDHIWLLNIAELFKGSRYILWLTPGGSQASGSIVERQVAQLRTYVEERAQQSDNTITRQINSLDEKISEIHAIVEDKDQPDDEDDESDYYSEDESEDEKEVVRAKLENLEEMVKKLCDRMSIK